MRLEKNLIATFLFFLTFFFSSCTTINSDENETITDEKPNILWITCEDISPYLGAYGCKEAYTPNLDKLAEKGILYSHAYANAPVCAVARSTILSGMYASTIGTHQMRSRPQLPDGIPVYASILRESGYYCTNNSKTDYNSNLEYVKDSLWDETSRKAHWKNRPDSTPFFSVFNISCTHEGQLGEKIIAKYIERGEIPEKTRIAPEDIKLPPYHPDLPEIRQDWARLHDMITRMDEIAGGYLKELEEENVADNTIIFFYSDHGGQLSGSKRFIYNRGTRVPFIVYLPEKWKHLAPGKSGKSEKSLVSFVDFPKTILSISGCEIPEKMQGHIFLGDDKEDSPGYIHIFRDRMAERYDFSRAVTDGKYYFIRNFMPHRPNGRAARYGYDVQSNWRAWENHFARGKCNEIQSQFYQPKPNIQLFDLESDPWEVNNLAFKAEYKKKVDELSGELDRWMIETRDIGLIPEPMFNELLWTGRKYKTLYEYGQSEDYEIERILEAAKLASAGKVNELSTYKSFIKDNNPVIRYWGVYGIFLINTKDEEIILELKNVAGKDRKAANRILAAQALGLIGDRDLALEMILNEIDTTTDPGVFLWAINAIQYSKTDDMLRLTDWQMFLEKTFIENSGIDLTNAAYANRIITEAISLWPEKRDVY